MCLYTVHDQIKLPSSLFTGANNGLFSGLSPMPLVPVSGGSPPKPPNPRPDPEAENELFNGGNVRVNVPDGS